MINALKLISLPCFIAFICSRWPSILARGESLAANISAATLIASLLAILSAWTMLERKRVERKDEDQDHQSPNSLFVWHLRRPHMIQTLAQGLVYTAWCFAWPTAIAHIPLLIAQFAFAYLIDMAIGWRYHNTYRLGLSPIPIVMSTNLFLFFRDDYFTWQWVLIAFALISRELFKWRREGRVVHIFNPSAIALSIFALLLIMTNTMHNSWGEAIARAHGFSSLSYEVIFASGLLVSSFFTVGFTIASSAISTLLLGEWYFGAFGVYRYVDTSIPIAVFLGMNLLVTDPVSSPWRRDSKIVYGALYGVSVFILYGLLRDLERPPSSTDVGLSVAFCDKLLAVPLLNLLSPKLDRLMAYFMGDQESGISRSVLSREKELSSALGGPWLGRLLFIALWIGLFTAWVRPSVREHPGRQVSFWVKACEETKETERHRLSCENRDRMYLRACESGALPACHNLALSREESDPKLSIELYEHGCEGGLAESCNHVGGMLFIKAEEQGDTQMILEADRRLKIACDAKIAEACTRRATLLRSRHLDRSRWGEKEWYGVWSLLNQACEGKEPYACLELSQLNLIHPQSAQQRCSQGEELFCVALQERQRSTIQDKVNVPASLLRPHHQQIDFSQVFVTARNQLTIACEAGLKIACINLAWMTWRGDGGERSIEKGTELMNQMCQEGEQVACERLQWMLQNKPSP